VKKTSVPLISVTIATHNSLRTIEKCLRSIQGQTYPNLEVIVVDSLQYDSVQQSKCKKVISKYGRYIQDGPERSIQRNRGIKAAKGEYVLVIDQDMYLTPEVIAECYQTLTQNKYIALNIPEISIGEGFWTTVVSLERYVSIYLEDGANECCRFFRKKDALELGGYDPSIVGAEDSDFHYRMLAKGKIGKITHHILHDEGKTKFWNRIKKKYYYSQAFREYVKRRPNVAITQFFPIKPAYFKHWKVLAKQPIVTLGIVALRTGEVLAGGMGILIK